MKYQIILSSFNIIPDNEFKKYIIETLKDGGFTILEARSLEGIKEELWNLKETEHETTETKFIEIKELFKLD